MDVNKFPKQTLNMKVFPTIMYLLPTSPLKSSASLTPLTCTLWFVRECSSATCCELDRGGSTSEVVEGLMDNFHLWSVSVSEGTDFGQFFFLNQRVYWFIGLFLHAFSK